ANQARPTQPAAERGSRLWSTAWNVTATDADRSMTRRTQYQESSSRFQSESSTGSPRGSDGSGDTGTGICRVARGRRPGLWAHDRRGELYPNPRAASRADGVTGRAKNAPGVGNST